MATTTRARAPEPEPEPAARRGERATAGAEDMRHFSGTVAKRRASDGEVVLTDYLEGDEELHSTTQEPAAETTKRTGEK